MKAGMSTPQGALANTRAPECAPILNACETRAWCRSEAVKIATLVR